MPWWIWLLAVTAVSIALPHGLTAFFSADTALWLSHVEDKYAVFSDSAWILANLAPFVAFWPWAKLSPRLRPLAVCCCLLSLSDATYYVARVVNLTVFGVSSDTLNDIFPLLYNIRAFITVVVLLVLLWLLFRDQRRIVEERAQLAGEMQAARDMQRILVPALLPNTPGLRIDSAFRPAQEVGGDFFQVLPRPDGSILIVLGDVSGKGLKAAMTGTLAIGALRTLAGDGLGPAALLTRLNSQIVDARQGGFITCLCAQLDPNGALTLANAGHLSPYLDGVEIALENGLPLGLSKATTYVDTAFDLAPKKQLTLLTDGVLEARNPTTGELFGFDRTAAISTQTADQIAKSAEHFGQDDDITVLTMTRLQPA